MLDLLLVRAVKEVFDYVQVRLGIAPQTSQPLAFNRPPDFPDASPRGSRDGNQNTSAVFRIAPALHQLGTTQAVEDHRRRPARKTQLRGEVTGGGSLAAHQDGQAVEVGQIDA